MNKAYMTMLKVIAFILVFLLGMVSSIALLIAAGVFAVDNVTLNKLGEHGVNVDTSALFNDEVAEIPIRDLTIVEIIEQIQEVSSMADQTTFETLSTKYGLVIPAKEENNVFDAMRDVPFSILFTDEGVDEIMKGIVFGELMGFELRPNENYDPNDEHTREMIWYDPIQDKPIWALEAVFCDHTLFDIIYNVNIRDEVNEVPIGDVLGYEYKNGEWYLGNGQPVEPVMAILADKTVSNLGSALEETPMGEFFGYKKEEDGKWYEKQEDETMEEVPPFMQVVADSTFSELDGLYEKITIADLVPEEERQTGYISLVDPDTHLSDVSTEVNRVFGETSLHEFIECGAIEVADPSKFAEGTTLGDMNIKELLEFAASMPVV